MYSPIFKLEVHDFIKGSFVAVFSVVLELLSKLLLAKGLFSLNAGDAKDILNIAVITFVSYLIKNFFTDQQGKVMGVKVDPQPIVNPPQATNVIVSNDVAQSDQHKII
ncbi:MAG: hypothetical protein NVSMB66_6170 [Candidatus Doudnabacteria bacterium]